MITIPLIFIVLLAYLIGSIPSSVWIGKWFYGVDVREEGSGNAGATNTLRVLGWKAGLGVLIFDVFKGWLAVSMVSWLPVSWFDPQYIDYYTIVIAVAAVLGHIFPVFAGFKGGKGVATLLGVGLAVYGAVVISTVGFFLFVLLFSGYVSLASILAALTFPLFVHYFTDLGLPYMILAFLVSIFVPLTHWKNIVRLARGKENKIRFRR
jgi:glycerol-3-phosphate acyltransferase PlsY